MTVELVDQDTLVITAPAAAVVEVVDRDTLVVTEPAGAREVLVITEQSPEVVEILGGSRGPAGPPGEGGGVSLPAGGTVGQILAKASSDDGDAEWTSLPASIKAQLNKQAYAGGPYAILEWESRPYRDTMEVIAPHVDTWRAPGVEAQRLAADGWVLTGKGGLFRLKLYLDFYVYGGALAVDEYVTITLTIKEAGGANVYAEVFNWPAGVAAYSQKVAEAWIPIPDTFGTLEWQVKVGTSKGATSTAWPIGPYVAFDLDRVAGWPVP